MFITLAIAVVWSGTFSKIGDLERLRETYERAYFISTTLVESDGSPVDWNYSTVVQIGLADGQNVISPTKWAQLARIDNYTLRDKTGASEYRLNLKLSWLNGTSIGQYGEPANSSAAVVSSILSYALYNNSVAKLEVVTWSTS